MREGNACNPASVQSAFTSADDLLCTSLFSSNFFSNFIQVQDVVAKMSFPDRPSGPIRQFSLQQQSRRYQQVRRQRSADDDKCPTINSKFNYNSKDDNKPKFRIAWGETRQKTFDLQEQEQVQIVARQISGKSKPLVPKARGLEKKTTKLDKASILYSHQELAERLRLAWKQREERKANIDIFLARNTSEDQIEKNESNDKFQIIVPTLNLSSIDADDGKSCKVPSEENEKKKVVDKKDQISGRSKTKSETVSPDLSFDSESRVKVAAKCNSVPEDPLSQAKMKRAGFRSGTNKAFNIVLEDKSSKKDDSEESGVEHKIIIRTVSSAPSHGRLEKTSSIEKVEDKNSEEKSCRPLKSAPLKRRIKSCKRRGFMNSKDGTRKNRNKMGDAKLSDVVTMVSLVSSADSDSDVDEHTDDKLIHQLRNKLPTTPIIKSSVRPASTTARRPIKSVSFHQSSFDSEWISKDDEKEEKQISTSNSVTDLSFAVENNSMIWKSEDNLALPLLQLSHEVESLETPLTEREKRCLVVPIGDLRDKKRKLQKTRTLGPKPTEMPCPPISVQDSYSQLRILQPNTNNIQPTTALQDPYSLKVPETSIQSSITIHLDERVNVMSSEPSFQTTKEKECWHLYRRMCDKGVCVSFDTVLRGMLTPTEYRLRQKEMSQSA